MLAKSQARPESGIGYRTCQSMVRKQETEGAIMILFYNRIDDIQVMLSKRKWQQQLPDLKNLGRLIVCLSRAQGDQWIWDFSDTSFLRSSAGFEVLDGSEKQDLIGMIDKLNGLYYRTPNTIRARWQKITGLTGATL